MTRSLALLGLAVAVVAVVAVACTSSSTPSPAVSLPGNPPHARLLAAADLDPCPHSSAKRISELPDVTLRCLGRGPAVHLAGLGGRPTVVNVWGSWCEPCQRETPYLSRVYDALKTKVRFLGVDDEDSVDSALDFATHVAPPMKYPSVIDEDKKVLIALHTIAVPITVFVSSDGHIVHTSFKPYASASALRADITHYLGVPA